MEMEICYLTKITEVQVGGTIINNNNNNTLFQTIVHMDNKKNKIQC